MFKKENLDLIREKIKKDHLKGYLIVTGDPHASEYAGEYFLEERKKACPFSGSAGQVLITLNHAYLLYIDTLQKARNIIPSYQAVTEDNVKCLQSGFLADKSVDIGHKKE